MLSPLMMLSLIPLFGASQNFIFLTLMNLFFTCTIDKSLPEFEGILFTFVSPQKYLT